MTRPENGEPGGFNAEAEKAYRRGFCHGLSEAVDLLGLAHPDAAAMVKTWLDGPVWAWRYPRGLLTPRRREPPPDGRDSAGEGKPVNGLAQCEVWVYAVGMALVSETLRRELERCGQSRYAVSKATGIPESVLSRFAHGQPLRGANLDKLADYLGLVLVAKASKTTKGR